MRDSCDDEESEGGVKPTVIVMVEIVSELIVPRKEVGW